MRRLGALTVSAAILLPSAGPAGAQRGEPVRVALVIPVNAAALFTPAGEPTRDTSVRVTAIANALRDLGRAELAEVPLALAPSPLLCDELQLLGGDAAGRALGALRALAGRLQLLSSPYADIRLTDLGTTRAVASELSKGNEALSRCAGASPGGVVATPDLRVDDTVLDGAAAYGSGVLLVGTDLAQRRPSLNQGFRTLVPADFVPEDYTPDQAFGLFQKLDAAAAMIAPERSDLVTFLRAMANDPRIDLVTIDELTGETTPGRIFTSFGEKTKPPDSYRRALDSALGAVERFRRFTLPNNRLATVMRTSIARARSSAEWDEDWSVGRRRARAIVRALARQEVLVSATGGSVTFTSQSGSVPVTVTNAATYPVRVRVQLSSTKLRFPEGSARTVSVDPPGDTIVFSALARTTGSFPVQVRVASPDGSIHFHSSELTVRSTAANLPALVITTAAAAFLLVWYGRHLARRRRERRPS